MDAIVVKLLGTPSVQVGGNTISFPYKKVDAFFYYLLTQGEVSRADITDLLWDTMDMETGCKNLRHVMYSLRQRLGCEAVVRVGKEKIALNPEIPLTCDLWNFLQGEDVDSYQGTFLSGFSLKNADNFDRFLGEQRNVLHQTYLKRLLLRGQRCAEGGNLEGAVADVEKYLALEPLDEKAISMLMNLHRSQRHYHRAVDVYNQLCTQLSTELSIAPLKETTTLYYEIVNEWNTATNEATDGSEHILVGRQSGLRFLQNAYENLLSDGRKTEFLLIQGDAGVGKSCLLEYFLNHYDLTDSAIFRTACYPSEINAPLAPWHTISVSMTEVAETDDVAILPAYRKAVAGLFPAFSHGSEELPSLGEFTSQHNPQEGQDALLLLLTKVVAKRPTVLIFEDIHWMDPHSIALMGVMLRRLQGKRLLLICSARTGLPQHVVTMLGNALEDNLLSTHLLENLTREESEIFIQRTTELSYSQDEIARIYQHTEGNPLLLQQLLNALEHQEEITLSNQEAGHIIGHRLALLQPPLKQLLDIISLFPDSVPLTILQGVTGKMPLELFGLGEQLQEQQLVTMRGGVEDSTIAIAHHRIQEVLRGQQNPALRRLLHLRVANHLERENSTISELEQLSYHYAQGGDRFAAFTHKIKALNLYTELCYELFPVLDSSADTEIPEEKNLLGLIAGLDRELDTFKRTGLGGERLDQLGRMLYHAKGRFYIQKGLYHLGLPAIEELMIQCTQMEDFHLLAQAHRQMCYYAIQTHRMDLLGKHADVGLTLALELQDPLELANQHRLKGYYHIQQGAFALGRDQLLRSIALLQQLSDERYHIIMAGAHYYLGESYRLAQNFPLAYEAYEQALALNRGNQYISGVAVFYTGYGQAAFQNGDFQRSRYLFEAARATYTHSRESSWYPVALAYGALFNTEDGDYPQAAEWMQDAIGIANSMESPLWKGLVLHVAVRIRRILAQRGVTPPCLERLWQRSITADCIRALELIPACPYQWEQTQLKEFLAELS